MFPASAIPVKYYYLGEIRQGRRTTSPGLDANSSITSFNFFMDTGFCIKPSTLAEGF